MIVPVLCCVLLCAQAPDRARLHPADSVLLVEIPDVPKLLDAYEHAPFVQLVRDEKVRATVGSILDATQVHVDEHVRQALLGMGLPESFASAPLESLKAQADELASFSLSLSMRGEVLGPLAQTLGFEAQAAVELAKIQEAISSFRSSLGKSPATLDDLALDESLATDPWGQPYSYSVDAEQGTGTAICLGADGKLGGAGVDADFDSAGHAEHIGRLLASELPRAFAVLTVLEFRSQNAADEGRGFIELLAGKIGAQFGSVEEFRIGQETGELQRVAPGPSLPVAMWTLRYGSTLALGIGDADLQGFAARAADPKAPSAASTVAKLVSKLAPAEGATVVRVCMVPNDALEALRGLGKSHSGSGAFNFAPLLELTPDAQALRIQLAGERFVTELVAQGEASTKGWRGAFGTKPFPPALLDFVPEDAIGVYGTTFDGPKLYQMLLESLADEATGGVEGVRKRIAELEQRMSFDLEHDIFASLGSGAVAYLPPLATVAALPGVAITIEVRDATSLERGIKGLMALLEEQSEGAFTIRSKPYRDAPMWTFQFGEENGGINPFQPAPTVTIVKDRLVIAINSTRAKKEIKRALGEEKGKHVVAQPGTQPPAEASTFGYMDWGSLLADGFDKAKGLAGLAGGMMGGEMPIDIASLPPGQTFTHFFKPSRFYCKSIPGGTYLRNESSFGPETWLSLIGLGAGAVLTLRDASPPDEVVLEPDVVVPPEAPAEPAAPAKEAQATRESLSSLATAIAVYKLDQSRYPAKLDELLTKSARFPNGYLKQGVVPNDGWNRAFAYTLQSDGSDYRLWSKGPDGIDQGGQGDDLALE
jgi:type II secretion system (T2SS) protein G